MHIGPTGPSDPRCVICDKYVYGDDAKEDVYTAACYHVMHQSCATRWVAQCGSPSNTRCTKCGALSFGDFKCGGIEPAKQSADWSELFGPPKASTDGNIIHMRFEGPQKAAKKGDTPPDTNWSDFFGPPKEPMPKPTVHVKVTPTEGGAIDFSEMLQALARCADSSGEGSNTIDLSQLLSASPEPTGRATSEGSNTIDLLPLLQMFAGALNQKQ